MSDSAVPYSRRSSGIDEAGVECDSVKFLIYSKIRVYTCRLRAQHVPSVCGTRCARARDMLRPQAVHVALAEGTGGEEIPYSDRTKAGLSPSLNGTGGVAIGPVPSTGSHER